LSKYNFDFKTEEIIIPKEALEIFDYDRHTLLDKLSSLVNNVYGKIESNSIPILDIPVIDKDNIIHNKHGNYFLGKKTRRINYEDKQIEFLKVLRVIEYIKELLTINMHSTNSEIYYYHSDLFKDQKDVEKTVDQLAIILQTYYTNLNILSAFQGFCIGRLLIKDNNDIIDCEALGSGPWAITPWQQHVEILESKADFILVLDNRNLMERLIDIRIWKTIPCILISTQGIPDYATREFIKKLVLRLKIPVLGLINLNPYNLNSLMTYAYGNVQTAHETSRLAINNFYWIGILCNDLETYNFTRECNVPMNRNDTSYIELLLDELPVKNNELLREELKLMVKIQVKTKIESLSSEGFKDFAKYITDKIKQRDLIEFY
jgi:DNA topoisomerase VI subunit A